METTKWAPLICTRTKTVDQWELMKPSGLPPGLDEWMWNIARDAKATMSDDSPPRWVIAKKGGYTLVGVACMHSRICEDQQYAHDAHQRSIPGFFGYVAKGYPENVPDRNLDTFKPLFERVKKVWDRKSRDNELLEELDRLDENIEHARVAEISAELEKGVAPLPTLESGFECEVGGGGVPASTSPGGLTTTSGRVRIFPPARADEVWRTARECQGEIAVCLGIDSGDAYFAHPRCFDLITQERVEKVVERDQALPQVGGGAKRR